MDDALRVGLMQSGAHLPADLYAFPQTDGAHPVDDGTQALALDVFHRQVGGRAGTREFVDARDVLMGDAA